jgi:hypothetical protein
LDKTTLRADLHRISPRPPAGPAPGGACDAQWSFAAKKERKGTSSPAAAGGPAGEDRDVQRWLAILILRKREIGKNMKKVLTAR